MRAFEFETALDEARAQRVEAIRAAAESLSSSVPVPVGAFVADYYADADLEDLGGEPSARAAAALSHLGLALHRAPETPLVRVFNPSAERDGWSCTRTIVQTVNDDMPFLVDSLSMKLHELGHPSHATVHPILRVERAADGRLLAARRTHRDDKKTPGADESFIHFEIRRETDPRILEEIAAALTATLHDVRAAVRDWRPMLQRLRHAAVELRGNPTTSDAEAAEACAFLEWLADDHFTLLGYREYELHPGDEADELRAKPGTGLGLLREEPADGDVVWLAGAARAEARSSQPLVVTKSDRRSTVHRPARLDHVGVKVFGPDGVPQLERRFLGLFTSSAYNESPRDIPLLRAKIAAVMRESRLDTTSHRGRALQHILDTLPRDDLFQASTPELLAIATGILALEGRYRVRLFCRREIFGRFYSCLVYLPRDQYSQRARAAIESILLRGLAGTAVSSELTISESVLARLAVTVHVSPSDRTSPDVAALEAEIAQAVRTWSDRVREALLADLPEERALSLLHAFGERLTAAYREAADPARACEEIQKIAALEASGDEMTLGFAPAASERPERVRFTAIKRGEPIPLYVAVPILENLGFQLVYERIFPVELESGRLTIQDFELQMPVAGLLDAPGTREALQECFALVFAGEAENDGFNRFIASAGLDWRQAMVLRSIGRYIVQTGVRHSQAYMIEVLQRFPAFCRALVEKFLATFDPDLPAETRQRKLDDAEATLQQELDRTVSLDDDRILRAFLGVVAAILRTNYFQLGADGRPKPYVSYKIDPSVVPELPKPRPKYEIFVYSQRVEGVHLRSTKVARGGIRWSDRREDFRTEILGLMKAQTVKNSVIVPSGAKGGFVCKALPTGDRDAVQREVVACYQTFIRGLLDLTDNIVDGAVRPPARVLPRDDDDPYLVVAADKGTAAFSDIANALAAEYGFWLGDAFASGGSSGYDHKKMGITARGAWESVKRHFRELGIDTQSQEFTVVGIGDMSGDVFGNGMLRSPHIKLVAAFDHRHVFVDPDPDPARSFAERERLFALPRSSWDDYDRSVLSEGGGIYPRNAKSIELHPKAQALLDLPSPRCTPPELIRAVLRARVDLLWNGGIGTYVKSSEESHADAGDPTNDAVRVDGRELRCRVVGEGGNLGFTQRGRIEYAQHGGRINTDFIDNSGGVDSSDREVNIKILLADAIRERALPPEQRDALLASMTDDVAGLVLADNYGQTLALSIMERYAAERLGEHARLIKMLESQGLLDRALEFLPTDEQIEERRAAGRGLTRPELAVILSYAKIELTASLLETDIPEDPYLGGELERYFPPQLRTPIGGLIRKHRLAREIIAMLIGGSMVNRMGPFFVLRAEEETGASVAAIARAYAIVREVFGVRQLWREIEALDYRVAAHVQYDAIFAIGRMVRRAVYWLLQSYASELDIEATVMRFRAGAEAVLGSLPAVLGNRSAERFMAEMNRLVELGLPEAMAQRIAALGFMTQVLDVVEIAREFRRAGTDVARGYFHLAEALRLDLVRDQIESLKVEGRWRAMARTALRDSVSQQQRALLRSALAAAPDATPGDAVAAWLERRAPEIGRVQRTLDEMQSTGLGDFATPSVALSEIARLV